MIVDPAQSILDLSTTLRDRGADGALQASGEWAEKAWDVLKALAASGREFSAEDIRERAGDPPSPNAIGSVILNGLKAGFIRNIAWGSSSRVNAHRRRIGTYVGVAKEPRG